MLKYLKTCATGVHRTNLRAIIAVNYYYETLTDVVYMQGEYEGNFVHTDSLTPMIKPDGTYFTYAEWCASEENEAPQDRLRGELQ